MRLFQILRAPASTLLFLLAALLVAPRAEALTITGLDAKAKPLGCDEEQPGICSFMIDGNLKSAGAKRLGRGFTWKLSYGGLVVYKSTHRMALKRVRLGNRTLWTIKLRGTWLVAPAMRQDILENQTTLALHGAKAVKRLETTEPPASLDDNYNYNYRLASDPADQDDEVGEGEAEAPPPQRAAAPAAAPTEKRSPSTFKRFEAWATGKDAPDTRIASLVAKAGSPLSPTGMYGAALEFFPSPILPIRISGGTYDSHMVFSGDSGSIAYSNLAVGTGLLIGRRNAQLDFGLDYACITAHIRPGIPSATDAQSNVTQSTDTTYYGVIPHLGLRLVSDSEFILSFEAGMFMPRGGSNALLDQGAPMSSTSDLADFHNRAATFNIGLGLYL